MKDDETLEQYKTEFHLDHSIMEEQRDKCNEEFRFTMVPGGQWEGFLEEAYENRSRLELDQVSDYLWRTYDTWTESRRIPTFSPEDDATDDDAELLNGLIRRDLRRKGGQSAVDVAVLEQMACGVGAVHLSTEYEDDEDPDNYDQNIAFTDINNSYSMVVWDSGAKRLDKADSKRCTMIVPMTRASFEKIYPDVDPVSAVTPDDRRWFNWTTPDLVYIAIRYDVVTKSKVVYSWANIITEEVLHLEESDLEDAKDELELNGFEEIGKKRINKREVMKTKFCGSTILEKSRRVAGKYIPIIPFYGYRAFIDGVEFMHGLIRKRMDAQRLTNMSISLAAEGAAHSHEDKLIFAPEQVEGLEASWAGDTHQKAYLLAHPLIDEEGTIVHNGPVGVKPGGTISQSAQILLQTAGEFIRQGTGGAPQDTLDTDASGKAINAIIKQVDKNSGIFFENIETAIKHMGVVYREIAREVYAARPGRRINILNKKDEPINTQLVTARAENGGIVRSNDPSKGRYQVVVDSGPAYETQREETVEALKDIYQAIEPGNPLKNAVLMKIITMLPSSGMDDIKDYVHQQLLLQGITKPESEKDIQFLESQAQNQQPDEQADFMKAAAAKEESEAMRNAKEIEQMDYENAEKQADTEKKLAEAEETRLETRLKALGLN